MRTQSFLFLALLLVTTSLNAQIRLVCTQYDQAAQRTDVLRFNALTGVVSDTVQTTQSTISIGSSVFDAFTGTFYFRSIPGLNSVEFDPDGYSFVGTIDILTSAEIDMSNGLIFGARTTSTFDSLGNLIAEGVEFVRYDISNNTDTALGSFAGTYGVVLDASAYNSNTGEYFFIGTDSTLGTCLYTVPTRGTGAFSYTQVPLSTGNLSFYALEYDNEYNVLYGLAFIDLVTSFNLQLHQIVPSTGALTLEADWPQLTQFQVSSHTFDQTSSSFIVNAGDANGLGLRIYNTVTNTLVNGVLPGPFLNGIEADNSQFAFVKYLATAGVAPATNAVRVFPNPVQDAFQIDAASPLADFTLYDLSGRMVHQGQGDAITTVDCTGLPTGLYLLQGRLADGSSFRSRIVKQ